MSEKTFERTKAVLQIVAPIVTMLAATAVPALIAWIGGEYTKSVKESENRVRFVELAIAQLRASPTPETTALREWAVELLDSQAPIKLSPVAREQLKKNALQVVQLSASAHGAVLASGALSISAGKAIGDENSQASDRDDRR